MEKDLPYVDVFVPSVEEIAFMIDRPLFEKRMAEAKNEDAVMVYQADDCTGLAEKLISMGSKIILIKCGIRGLYLRTGKEVTLPVNNETNKWSNAEIWAPSFKTDNFASTLGAGDSTIAGFLCGLIRGFSPEEALTIANTVGWQNVQTIDTLSGIKDWQRTLELAKDQTMAQNPPRLDAELWRHSQTQRVYYGSHHEGPNVKLA